MFKQYASSRGSGATERRSFLEQEPKSDVESECELILIVIQEL